MRYLLFPFSLLYALVMRIRNFLFDKGILTTTSFPIPLIAIGNITMGGTGKTPHTEYLIRLLLQKKQKIAVLSRGYGRKSHGFIKLSVEDDVSRVGDEPLQMKQKYPSLCVAVDEDRVDGVKRLLAEDKNLEAILLDDAYQHRYIKPSYSILLVDYARPLDNDRVLPAGRLREPRSGVKRADAVVITKCPSDLDPQMCESAYRLRLGLEGRQNLYFTTITYDRQFYSVANKGERFSLGDLNAQITLLVVTGIASPQPFYNYLKQQVGSVIPLSFPDHHRFTEGDLLRIEKEWQAIASRPAYVVTTEKDAMRLRSDVVEAYTFYTSLYYCPISVKFLGEGETYFNQEIYDHIGNYRSSSNVSS